MAKTEIATLVYPEYYNLAPTDFLVFAELAGFHDDWTSYGLDDDHLNMLQVCIMCNPTAAIEFEGTGGLREAFFSPASTTSSCGLQTITVRYVYFDEFSSVLLVVVYDGHEDLTDCERKIVRSLIEIQREELSRHCR